uniref:Ribonuclease H2 subunit B wHTH domain-containing protein n=1 Tax=Entomoneis paludosa TaxID=265537 RepID=A0A7S3DU72_9STRA|mmetsp:Transcript_37067/g.77031  ORF Transcript_37067/g.77031 Transcript_37067/m.77031 type:complete len:389 (+) Transcript_37067:25-1191(+)|eukprot:CAMPEP_0172451338 /NCGR_PEP_ID=MMETSP1065-20121228/9425_1 /TAXON_ID=265537 /ORGANISM="Amphiprora paludosa, Strain CCMP125" /LENGTH=388 /DNA_ID=CAMNT_0013203289 /DNA_START=21 /DNA_END=1187 /DNA_ORIENTATION=-
MASGAENGGDKNLIVALLGTQTTEANQRPAQNGRKDRPSLRLHHREDPSTNERRVYLVIEASESQPKISEKDLLNPVRNRLCEIQVLPPKTKDDKEPFSSFLIKSESTAQVVGNDKLYTITDVDPLFFLLPSDSTSESPEEKKSSDEHKNSNRQQWQPLDQILGPLDATLKSCLDPKQISHLYATMKLSPEESFYKFSPVKTLSWLTKKHEALQNCLLQQRRQHKTKDVNVANKSNAAFASGFRVAPQKQTIEGSKNDSASSNAGDTSKDQLSIVTAKEESIQIICSYLSEEWRTRFLNHLNVSSEVLQTTKQRAAKRVHSEVSKIVSISSVAAMSDVAAEAQGPPEKKPKKESFKSAGIQKLKKVNTTGMKTMSSFFKSSAPKKKTK